MKPVAFPDWAIYPALLVVSVGSLVRFRAHVADWPIILAASALALIGSRIGKAYLGDILGMFLASLMLGFAAGLYGRWARRPNELIVVPGLALLVPGSVGYRSLETLAGQNADEAIVTAFQMFMIAMALVAGLLFSNALVRQRIID
ncbi:MAG TPA: threonine/serine exporter family protein [Pirellulales bacterium]